MSTCDHRQLLYYIYAMQSFSGQSDLMLLPIPTAQPASSPVTALGLATPDKCVYLCVSSRPLIWSVFWVSFRRIWSCFITNVSASIRFCQVVFSWSGFWPGWKTQTQRNERKETEVESETERKLKKWKPRCMEYSVQGKMWRREEEI